MSCDYDVLCLNHLFCLSICLPLYVCVCVIVCVCVCVCVCVWEEGCPTCLFKIFHVKEFWQMKVQNGQKIQNKRNPKSFKDLEHVYTLFFFCWIISLTFGKGIHTLRGTSRREPHRGRSERIPLLIYRTLLPCRTAFLHSHSHIYSKQESHERFIAKLSLRPIHT